MTAKTPDPNDGLGLDLTEEAAAERLLRAQRDANQTLLLAALRARDQVEACEAAVAALRQAEHDLREMAEVREQFLGVVGHDLRQPLNVIQMAGQRLLRSGRLSEEDAHVVGLIRSSAARMHRMILHLLDLTRTRLGGGLLLDRAEVDLGPICRQVAEGLQLQTERRVACELAGALRGVWDGDRLTEALENLCANALEHAAPGTDVTLRAAGGDGDVAIEVSNQGEPIPPEVLRTLFEPFRRGAKTPSQAGNLGLGLYIARAIAKAHRGSLDVRCEAGVTTFCLRLPRS